MAMTRHCIDSIGGFDTGFGKYGFEHIDYSSRAGRHMLSEWVYQTHIEGMENYIADSDGYSVLTEIEKEAAVKVAREHMLTLTNIRATTAQTDFQKMVYVTQEEG